MKGVQQIRTIKALLDNYKPNFHMLNYFLKVFLKNNILNKVYHGGLSSYCLMHMIIFYLKHIDKSKPNNNFCIGEHLFHFLDYFTNFNLNRHGIDINKGLYLKSYNIM